MIIQSIAGDEPIRIIDVLNKIDLVGGNRCSYEFPPSRVGSVYVSAATGEGIDELLNIIDAEFATDRVVVVYKIPSKEGAALAWLYNNGNVISAESQDTLSIVKVALQSPDIGRFARRYNLEPLR